MPDSARDAKDFTPHDIEVEILENHLLPETLCQAAYAYRMLEGGRRLGHPQNPLAERKIAKTPSSTSTRKMALTTAVVTCVPTDSALP